MLPEITAGGNDHPTGVRPSKDPFPPADRLAAGDSGAGLAAFLYLPKIR
jgi:hypothetical protein